MHEVKLPKPQRSAKQFLLSSIPEVLALFDVPKNILGFDVQSIVRKQIYAMSEETARRKLDALREMLQKWDEKAKKE